MNPLGDLLSILAVLVWAFYSVLIKQIQAPQSAPPKAPPKAPLFATTRKVFFYGFFFLTLVLPLFEFRLGLERLAELPNLLNLLFLGVGASALCFRTWNFVVHLLGPVKTSVYVYPVTLVSIAASGLMLKESITLVAALGMALILIGMVLSEREVKRE